MFITKYSPCILPFIPNVEVVQCLGDPKGIRAVCKRHRRRTGEGRPQTRMQIFCQKLKWHFESIFKDNYFTLPIPETMTRSEYGQKKARPEF